MARDKIQYRSGYKYQLVEEYSLTVSVTPDDAVKVDEFIDLSTEGVLVIKKGYAWDGPSGPTIDTKNFMRGSLVHDALYQLMREGQLPASRREDADKVLRKICRADGMSAFRAWYVYHSVRTFGGAAIKPKDHAEIEIIEAP